MNLYRGSFEAGKTRLTVHRTGGELPAVVLLHGLTDSGMLWSSLVAALAFSYDVVFPDMRGHGASDKPADNDYSIAAMAGDAAALIREYELDRPVVIGHSMGAAVTAYLGAEYRELTRGVVLIDPPWFDPALVTEERIADGTDSFRSDLTAYHAASYEDLIAEIRARNPNWAEEDYRAWAKAKQQATFESLAILPELVKDWARITAKMTLPALLMTGNPELNGIVTPEIARGLLAAHPNWSWYYSPISGHSVSRDDRAGSIKAIKTFLTDRFLED